MARFTSSRQAAGAGRPECLALMYHEVIAEALCGANGVPRKGADPYKIGEREFRRHVAAIRAAVGDKRAGRVDEPAVWRGERPLFLTFDDGEESAYTIVADLLEEHGWRGHFFVTTDFIGQPGFLTPPQIRELEVRGHVVGSHSCSHPVPISECTREQLQREWGESTKILSDITGQAVHTASVPGGFYSRAVAETAIEAGIDVLFTSEPRAQGDLLGDCMLLGRYAIRRSVTARRAAALASGRIVPRWRETAVWEAKKVLKRVSPRGYVRARQAIVGS